MYKRLSILLLVLLVPILSFGQTKSILKKEKRNNWIDSVYQNMSIDERLGQLIMIRAYSNKGSEHEKYVKKMITEYYVGGMCFFQGTPEKQIELNNKYQNLSKTPLLVAMDAEWGPSMRLKKHALDFPKQLMLGAIDDNTLIYEMGVAVAKQCKRLGVHVNFAPVVDVNNNPKNPVINTRSFGEDKYNVTAKSFAYMQGMQDEGIIACMKHFPGHGDTDVDSHKDLPVISHNIERLNDIEMFPFAVLSQHGMKSAMVAHLNIPAIDSTPNLPLSLSNHAITDILKHDMGFKGLIFTDGLEMKGVTKHFKPGLLEVMALQAGNDILLLPKDVPLAIKSIKESLENKTLSLDRIEESVKKILAAKYDLNLYNAILPEIENAENDLKSFTDYNLKNRLIKNAITIAKDESNILPINPATSKKIFSIQLGDRNPTLFQNKLDKYHRIIRNNLSNQITDIQKSSILKQVSKEDIVILSVHNMSFFASKMFGLTESEIKFINDLNSQTQLVLVLFGNPYSLQYFDNINNVILAFNEDEITQGLVPDGIFGIIGLHGHLPVSAGNSYKYRDGKETTPLGILGYGSAKEEGLNPDTLLLIDSIAEYAIDIKATPGIQVLIAKNNKIVFNKSYGFHTYKKKEPYKNGDLFDLASVTKISAATLSIIKLYDEGKIDIYKPMSDYLPMLKGTNKEDLIIKDFMTHHGLLKPWIPFYKNTIEEKRNKIRPLKEYYRKSPEGDFTVKITDKLFMDKKFQDSIWIKIIESDLRETREYKYSDLGFILSTKLIQAVTGKTLDQYVDETFYKPMGLITTGFNPLRKFEKKSIIPSEKDKYWRKTVVQGRVHDMASAMLGGVSGHAGLFSNAEDLSKLLTLFLNKGYYGGHRYFSAQTFEKFIHRPDGNTRRGIGFDMKELDKDKSLNMSKFASESTFGHMGFTGISVWIDPEYDMIFIFLSNRTFPTMKNKKLITEDIRPKIQSIVYRALLN